MIRGDGRDERWARIDLAATALAGLVVISSIIIACGWEWAHGRDGTPFVQLGAIAGVAYIAALAVLLSDPEGRSSTARCRVGPQHRGQTRNVRV